MSVRIAKGMKSGEEEREIDVSDGAVSAKGRLCGNRGMLQGLRVGGLTASSASPNPF